MTDLYVVAVAAGIGGLLGGLTLLFGIFALDVLERGLRRALATHRARRRR